LTFICENTLADPGEGLKDQRIAWLEGLCLDVERPAALFVSRRCVFSLSRKMGEISCQAFFRRRVIHRSLRRVGL